MVSCRGSRNPVARHTVVSYLLADKLTDLEKEVPKLRAAHDESQRRNRALEMKCVELRLTNDVLVEEKGTLRLELTGARQAREKERKWEEAEGEMLEMREIEESHVSAIVASMAESLMDLFASAEGEA